MCMEDVRLGRKVAVTETVVPLLVSAVVVADYSPKRTLLIFYPPVSGTTTLSIGNTAVAGSGVTMTANSSPLILDIQKQGNLVTQRWFAIHSAGGVNCVFHEGLLEQE